MAKSLQLVPPRFFCMSATSIGDVSYQRRIILGASHAQVNAVDVTRLDCTNYRKYIQKVNYKVSE
jgi:hypothetical protein